MNIYSLSFRTLSFNSASSSWVIIILHTLPRPHCYQVLRSERKYRLIKTHSIALCSVSVVLSTLLFTNKCNKRLCCLAFLHILPRLLSTLFITIPHIFVYLFQLILSFHTFHDSRCSILAHFTYAFSIIYHWKCSYIIQEEICSAKCTDLLYVKNLKSQNKSDCWGRVSDFWNF